MTASPAIDAIPGVPLPPTRLVGRDHDIEALITLLTDSSTRLVTITGPGGVGKTHLSLSLAALLASHFSGGIIFVPLASVRDPNTVLPEIARALGVREGSDQSLIETLGSALSRQDMLILLDNMEQVLEAVPDIGVLIAATARPCFLVTSRSPLRLRVEREYPLSPLLLPERSIQNADLSSNDAVTLFVERARSARPSFALTDDNASTIAEICRRLDGLPLAIELVAAMTRVLSPAAILRRMEQGVHLQTPGAADLPDRQRTLRDAIAWSHALLSPAEERLLLQLSVFASGAPLDGIEAVHGANEHPALLDVLTSLVEKSLLFRTDEGDAESDEPRFRMLGTIRDYALGVLETRGTADSVREEHLTWLLNLVAEAEPALTGPDQARWLLRLDAEHDNIRAALTWTLETSRIEGLRLASMLWRYWATRGLLSEGHSWLSRLLTMPMPTPIDENLRARALGSLGNLSIDLGDYDGAASCYAQALEIRQRIGPERGIADALNGLGLVDSYRGDYDSARVRHSRSLEIRRRTGDLFGQANSLTNLGDVIKDSESAEASRPLHEEALAIRQSLGDRGGVGYSYYNLGDIARRLGHADEARSMFARSLAAFREVRDTLGVGYAMHGLGMAELLAGSPRVAAAHLFEALATRSSLGDRRGMIECIEGIALTAAGSDRPQDAAHLFGATDALRTLIGAPLPLPEEQEIEPALERIRRELPSSVYSDASQKGASLDLITAVELATMTAKAMTAVTPTAERGPLSEREIEVVRLVASGMTNGEVADQLFLSRRTVDAHLRRIYDKLGFSSRTDVVRYAIEHDLA